MALGTSSVIQKKTLAFTIIEYQCLNCTFTDINKMLRHSSRLKISRGLLSHVKWPFRATNSCRVPKCLWDSSQIPQDRTLK